MSHQQTEDEASLVEALRSISPPSVRVGARLIAERDVGSLFDVEQAAVHSAVDRRKREFATGRVLLRDLMRRDVAIPVADDRSPVLPAGVRASLAHDHQFAVAAVTDDADVAALGIDVEPTGELDPGVADLILRSDEAGLDPHLAFTLKEAAYKAWSSLGGRMLEHQDVRITSTDHRFTAAIPCDVVLSGVYTSAAGRWLALVVVPKSANR